MFHVRMKSTQVIILSVLLDSHPLTLRVSLYSLERVCSRLRSWSERLWDAAKIDLTLSPFLKTLDLLKLAWTDKGSRLRARCGAMPFGTRSSTSTQKLVTEIDISMAYFKSTHAFLGRMWQLLRKIVFSLYFLWYCAHPHWARAMVDQTFWCCG